MKKTEGATIYVRQRFTITCEISSVSDQTDDYPDRIGVHRQSAGGDVPGDAAALAADRHLPAGLHVAVHANLPDTLVAGFPPIVENHV